MINKIEHSTNGSEIQTVGEFELYDRSKVGRPLLLKLHARGGVRYGGNFAALYSEHGEH